ncbi:DNA-protecting protein DprA [Parahaliea sp. F7430]|uniref:DNA-protecting protein DprA n=1 Tax=Sediminihaliea albiluteola TaxID=2758564 RepID=A0A7W2TXJ6_9GAMM|nr:DNA-processing protein DprA [Sediminihaliea albiluteola]MBA6413800.1 DNA-protecting protein DprA [Sediminihaliea albiluteola]
MRVETLRRGLLLQALPGCTDAMLRVLLRHYGGLEALWQSDYRGWSALGVPLAVAEAFERSRHSGLAVDSRVNVEQQLDQLDALSVHLLSLGDATYPPLLATIIDPPPMLYVRGDATCLLLPQLAVVGSRHASSAGLRAARELSAAAVSAGLTITSGLALGIDAAAHQAALDAGGTSVAVMATGIEQIYPRRHQHLAELVATQGCLVTEFPPGTQPLRGNFPRRNRIISGLSLGVLVVEAALPSGTLITAGTALEQGREVFTLPWSIYHPGGQGCLRLLRDGATQVQTLEDIVQELASLVTLQRDLSLAGPAPAPVQAQAQLRGDRQLLLSLIGDGTVAVDELVAHSQLPLPLVISLLSELELESRVKKGPGGYTQLSSE